MLTHLARHVAAIEHRTAPNLRLVIRVRMDINRVKIFVAMEKLLPHRRQWHRPNSQKHECNFRCPVYRNTRPPGHHGSSPQKLLIIHVMLHKVIGLDNQG